jgi:hypothetical protein
MKEMVRINPDSRSLLEANGLTDMSSVFALQQGERMDKVGLESWRQRWRIHLDEADGLKKVLYLKRFDRPPLRRQWLRWKEGQLFTSTAGVEWQNANALAEAGISAARPAAFGEVMNGPWERRSFIMLHEVSGQALEKWVPRNAAPLEQEDDLPGRRARLYELAEFVAEFHGSGFAHRDLYLSHIFIHETNEGTAKDGGRYTLIDLQRVFRPRWRQQRWVIKDLAALHYSSPGGKIGHRERLRFIIRYARHCSRFGSARQLVQKIATKVEWMNRRRPGPLVTD